MEPQNEQISKDQKSIEKLNNQNKNNNVVAEESSSCWKTPPLICIINVAEFWERAKSYNKEGGLLKKPNTWKRIGSVFKGG